MHHLFMQVHIEQGPVLEYIGYPVGIVKGIAGQTRLKVCWYNIALYQNADYGAGP